MGKSLHGFRYGTKEIIATLLGTALFVLAEWFERYLIGIGMIPAFTYEWVQFRVPVVTLVAILFGPFSGMICGLGADLIINSIFEPAISYPEVIVFGVYGFMMGIFHSREHGRSEQFTSRQFLDLNALQIGSGIFCSMFVLPFANFMIYDANIYDTVTIGAKSAAGNSLLTGVICSVIMAIRSVIHQTKSGKAEVRA